MSLTDIIKKVVIGVALVSQLNAGTKTPSYQDHSAPDLYKAAQTASDDELKILQSQSKKKAVKTETLVRFQGTNLYADIIHNYNSKNQKKINVLVPVYMYVPITSALSNTTGAAYLRALFNTTDGAEKIKQTLERLTGREAREIILGTPMEGERKKGKEFSEAVFGMVDSGSLGFTMSTIYKKPKQYRKQHK